MVRLFHPLAALLVAAAAVSAGERPGDTRFSAETLAARLSGISLFFFDGSMAQYDADGGYSYAYTVGGPEWIGRWETNDNSEVCVEFNNGTSRCDRIVDSGARLVLITAAGDRFPVREIATD